MATWTNSMTWDVRYTDGTLKACFRDRCDCVRFHMMSLGLKGPQWRVPKCDDPMNNMNFRCDWRGFIGTSVCLIKRVPTQRRPCSHRIKSSLATVTASHLRMLRIIINLYSTVASLLCRCLKTGNWFPPRPEKWLRHERIQILRLIIFSLDFDWEISHSHKNLDNNMRKDISALMNNGCRSHIIGLPNTLFPSNFDLTFPASTIITIRCYAALNFAVPLISISQEMKWRGAICCSLARLLHISRLSSPIVGSPKLRWFVNFKHARFTRYTLFCVIFTQLLTSMTLSLASLSNTFSVYLPNDLAASRGKMNKFQCGGTSGTVVQTSLDEGYEKFIFPHPNQSLV